MDLFVTPVYIDTYIEKDGTTRWKFHRYLRFLDYIPSITAPALIYKKNVDSCSICLLRDSPGATYSERWSSPHVCDSQTSQWLNGFTWARCFWGYKTISSGGRSSGKESDLEGEEVSDYTTAPSEISVSQIRGADSPSAFYVGLQKEGGLHATTCTRMHVVLVHFVRKIQNKFKHFGYNNNYMWQGLRKRPHPLNWGDYNYVDLIECFVSSRNLPRTPPLW